MPNSRRSLAALAAALALAACSQPGVSPTNASASTPTQRPNVLVILADDLGYSDIGAFGGEIPTPNLDALAAQGRMLTSHYVAPTCSPTRAMLMSGTDNHLAGLGSMGELVAATPALQGKEGYEGYLSERVLWLPELMRDAGYHTYMAGKWHLSNRDPKTWPVKRGFESSFALLAGGGPHFAPVPGKPIAGDQVPHVENDAPAQRPADYYSSDFFTDKLIAYIDRNKADGKPFFGYMAYTAPHWPLQAPDADIAKFAGRYDAGYEAIRQQRLERQRALGLIPAGFTPYTMPPSKEFPRWQDLSKDEQRLEARKMEVYAAMVHNMDRNIGRLVQYLKSIGQYDNTLILFQSDNGAEPSPSFLPNNANNDNSLQNIGRRLSNVGYGPRWAEVSATPFRYFKGYTSEGGISAPAFIRMPGQTSAQAAFTAATHVTDVAPTILELAGVRQPTGEYAGRRVVPMTGTSLLPALRRPEAAAQIAQRTLTGELFGGRYVRDAKWKLVSVRDPFSDNHWQLFDIANDRGETTDVAAGNPQIVQRMSAQWDAYAEQVGVVRISTKMPAVHYGATDPGLDRAAMPGARR